MLYLTEPKNFKSKFEVVSCFFEYHGKILLLQRQKDKPQPNTWGVPTGKVNPKEKLEDALIRESYEETKVRLDSKYISNIGRFYVRYKEYDFKYWLFKTVFSEKPHITINLIEHQSYYNWFKPKDALKMRLIQDMAQCIKITYRIK